MRARLLVVFVCLSAPSLTAATPAAAQFYAQHNLVSDRAGQPPSSMRASSTPGSRGQRHESLVGRQQRN